MRLCNPLVQAKRWRREAEEGAMAHLPQVHSMKTLEPAWAAALLPGNDQREWCPRISELMHAT